MNDGTTLLSFALGDTAKYASVARDLATSAGQRSQRSQAAILGAAWQLFQEEDYAQITMEDLARRAGVSRPSLYSYYHSKRSIFLAIEIACNAGYQERVCAFHKIDCGDDFVVQLSDWVDSYLKFWEEVAWARRLWDQVAATDITLREEGLRHDISAWRSFGNHLATLRGEHNRTRALAQGMMVLSMLERTCFYWTMSKAPVPRAQLVRECAEVLWGMVMSDPMPATRTPKRSRTE
jgi:AcrR family transcriptional regulator